MNETHDTNCGVAATGRDRRHQMDAADRPRSLRGCPAASCNSSTPARESARDAFERLDMLERQGVVIRRSYPESPPRVEYELTEKGRALCRSSGRCAVSAGPGWSPSPRSAAEQSPFAADSALSKRKSLQVLKLDNTARCLHTDCTMTRGPRSMQMTTPVAATSALGLISLLTVILILPL